MLEAIKFYFTFENKLLVDVMEEVLWQIEELSTLLNDVKINFYTASLLVIHERTPDSTLIRLIDFGEWDEEEQ